MRKLILVLLCAGNVVAANAQLNSVLLFGNFGGGMTTQNNPGGSKDVRNSFNIMPGVGYQLCPHWTIGVEGSFNYRGDNITTSGVTDKTNTTGYGGGVFARFTQPINPMLYFYTQGDATYTTSSEYAGGKMISGSTTNGMGLNITPAIGINIRNGYGLNFSFGSIGYNYSNTPSSKTTTSGVTYNFGQQFSIGVSKNFLHHMRVAAKPIEDMGSPSSNKDE
jgi:hypothetical protein